MRHTQTLRDITHTLTQRKHAPIYDYTSLKKHTIKETFKTEEDSAKRKFLNSINQLKKTSKQAKQQQTKNKITTKNETGPHEKQSTTSQANTKNVKIK